MKIKNIISISGCICSGKTYAANLIAKKFDFPVASFGDYLRFYCKKNNLPIDRNTLQEMGDKFIKKNPEKFLTDVIKHFIGNHDSIILKGVRHRGILNAIPHLTENKISIFIDTDLKMRFDRCSNREEFKTYDQFVDFSNHRVEVEIESLKYDCDIIVDSTTAYEKGLFKLINNYLVMVEPELKA